MKLLPNNFANWGVSNDMSPEEAFALRLTNGILFFMFVASSIMTTALFFSGAFQAAIVNSTAPMTFGFGLLAMRSGYTTLVRVIVVTIAYTGSYFVATILGPDSMIQLVALFGSTASFAIFPLHRKRLLVYGLTLPIIMFVTLELTNYEPQFGLTRSQLGSTEQTAIRIFCIMLIWMVMAIHFAYFIRDRRLSQERLVSSAKMVALGRMASGIAHEVNNPLQRIVGQTEALHKMVDRNQVTPDRIKESADKIQKVAMRIAAIVKGLQAVSRDATGEPAVELQLNSLVTLSLDYCRERLVAHDVALRVSDIPGKWTVMGREAELSEVLLNLINNAHDAIAELPEKWIQIDAVASAEHIDLVVTDSGHGISKKLQQRIFDPFFTTKPVGKGTGLGLSVSRGIMAKHNGDLFYDEKSPRTRFVIRIPRGPDSFVQSEDRLAGT